VSGMCLCKAGAMLARPPPANSYHAWWLSTATSVPLLRQRARSEGEQGKDSNAGESVNHARALMTSRRDTRPYKLWYHQPAWCRKVVLWEHLPSAAGWWRAASSDNEAGSALSGTLPARCQAISAAMTGWLAASWA